MSAILIPPGDGRSVSLGGIGVVFKISGAETGGSFSVVEHPVEPGRLVPPHKHTREDEFSYVLEGEIGVRIGDQEFTAGPGSYVYKPRGVPHTFWNAGPDPARLIEFICPAGFEKNFEALARLMSAGAPPGGEQHRKLRSEYGVTSEGMEWVPELTQKYGLRLMGQ